ncbi:MAG: sodium-dependent transporter [Endomicrobium sp.]|jgi:NSS family neurotransmitter:Na+ symporter|nr:sodium-dependent transporter [Endomicrobium sp.]
MSDSSKDLFSSKWGFILAAAGSAIGMGNIWLFPYRAAELNGAAFLTAYIICTVILGLVGITGEIALGRLTGKGPVGAFKKAFRFIGINNKAGEVIGWLPVIVIFILTLAYTVTVAWVLRFLAGSFTGKAFVCDSSSYFESITGNGIALWIFLTLLITSLTMAGGVKKGIEKVNKFMMPAFFILFILLVIRVAFLPRAIEGYKFMFTLKFNTLLNAKLWILALGQAFYSLSIMGSILIVYGSYARKSEDIIYSAKSVAVLSTLASVFACLAIIPAIFSFGKGLNCYGPSLMFISVPDIFKTMPLGRLCMIAFFIAVFFAAITSLISIIEVIVESLQNKFKLSRSNAVLASTATAAVFSIFADGHIDKIMDILEIHLIPLCALTTAIFIFWIVPSKRVIREIQTGHPGPISKWIIPSGRYIFCGLVTLIYIFNLLHLG